MRFLLTACAIILWAGCATPPRLSEVVIGPDFVVENVHRTPPDLPSDIKRIAVLPITGSATDAQAAHAREYFDEALQTELNKVALAETIYLARPELKLWTRQDGWRADEVLPRELLAKIAGETGAQAVFFVHLANYSPYPPLVLGWKMRLVRADNGETLWALDEVFDAGQEAVSNSARRFAKNRAPVNPALADSRAALLSPGLFARYTLCASFETLPSR